MKLSTQEKGHALSSGGRRAYRFSILRVLTFSVCMALLLAFELYSYHTVFDSFYDDLIEAEMESSAWIESQLAFMLPFLTVALFQYLVYRRDDREDGVFQREKAWEIFCVAVLVYGVILPVVAHMSRTAYEAALAAGEVIPTTAGGADETLLMTVTEWFIRLTVPLLLLGAYHGTRARREAEDAALTATTGEGEAVPS
jgi:purine-cytosine permease-like protein